MDLRFPHTQYLCQRIHRHNVAANILDLEIVPSQCASDSIRGAVKHPGGFIHRVRGQLLAQSLNLFLRPSPMFIPGLQASPKHKSPTCLSGAACLPLQASNELVEFYPC
jgi:hypothetical protein